MSTGGMRVFPSSMATSSASAYTPSTRTTLPLAVRNRSAFSPPSRGAPVVGRACERGALRARAVTCDTTLADPRRISPRTRTDVSVDRRGDHTVKTLRNAPIVGAAALALIALALIVPAPAHAKDQWVVAFGDEPFSLNPANKGAQAVVSDYVMIHLYDALVDFTGPDLAPKPMLAVRWESRHATTWRFTLRRGVKFHNGDPLTADDVKFTIDTQLANKGSSINTYLGPTEGARVIDPLTVEITTKTPFPPLIFNLTRLHILPRAYDKMGGDAFAAKPIGTGPYRFVEWQRGQRIVLDVNPDYWGGQATPKRLVFRPIADPSTR